MGSEVETGHDDLAPGPLEQRPSGVLLRLELHDRPGRVEPQKVPCERVHQGETGLGSREVVVREAVERKTADLADHIPEAEQVRLRVDPEVGRTGKWAPRED